MPSRCSPWVSQVQERVGPVHLGEFSGSSRCSVVLGTDRPAGIAGFEKNHQYDHCDTNADNNHEAFATIQAGLAVLGFSQ